MAALDSPEMWSRAVRIESFNKAQKKQKKRPSTQAKKTLTAKWPHETPSAEQLARAGFYFHFSNDEDVDSTRCFSCGLKLDGWEPEDDPVKEHIAHIKGSERCAWATCLSVARRTGEEPEGRDPLCEELFSARKDTFGVRWPHESKRTWKCKVDRMAEAGWSYDPSPEEADGVTCHYCGLELSGFEPKDDPFEEHKRRNDSCRFFELIDFYHQGKLPKRKKTKATKSRSSAASKASRTSMRSVVSTVVSEAGDLDDGDTDILGNDNTDLAAAVSQADDMKPKKTTKAKPTAKTAKGRKKAASHVSDHESDEPTQAAKSKPKQKKAAASKKPSLAKQRSSAASAQLQTELEESVLQSSPNYWVASGRESMDSARGSKRMSDGRVKEEDLAESDLDFPMPPSASQHQDGPKPKRTKTSKVKSSLSMSTIHPQDRPAAVSHEEDEQAISNELARIEAEETAKRPSKQASKKKSTSMAFQVLEDEMDDEIVAADTLPRQPAQVNITPSPSGSDKENDPSSLESQTIKAGKPTYTSPTKTSRLPLAQSTPNRPSPYRATTLLSPSKRQLGTMVSSMPWTAIDLDTVLLSPSQHSPGKLRESLAQAGGMLSQAERDMTVEAWIKWRAGVGEDELKCKGEEMVGIFERHGNRALECLHGLGLTA